MGVLAVVGVFIILYANDRAKSNAITRVDGITMVILLLV